MPGKKGRSGGGRSGAGRPPVGYKRLDLPDQETARKLYIVASVAHTTPEQWIKNQVDQAWQELDQEYQQRADNKDNI